jgi:putative sigma-54 modulation protein
VNLQITGRHIEVTDGMKEHIGQHVEKLPKFGGKIQYITVTLDVDGGDPFVELIAKCHRADLIAEARAHDMYACIDQAFAKLQRQITRHHDKLTSHKARTPQE